MLPSARLFRSRWAALLWAGGILWAAADVAGSFAHEGGNAAAPTADQAELTVDDLAALSNDLE